jgi:MoxR-like ATPase
MVEEVHPVMSAADIDILRGMVRSVHAEDKLLSYITAIVGNTRANKAIYLGASPRASIGIMNGSKAYAAMKGRDFITPEDIIYIAPAVLRHRITLSPEKEMEGVDADEIITQIIQSIEIPR